MRTALRYFLNGSMVALLLWQSGCGAFELSWLHRPNTVKQNIEKNDWSNWIVCPTMSLSSTGIKHDVFCLRDVSSNGTHPKPPVLLLHELTGLTPQTLRYAMELSEDFTVYIPMLFGSFGEESALRGPWAYWIGPWVFWTRQEWSVPSEGSTPMVKWLRDVVSSIERKHGPWPIRIIGNCMTGALPLALLDNAHVDAVVVAQPALPMRFWWWHIDEDYSSLGLSNDDLVAAQKSKAKILALRFETDRISPQTKLKALQWRFGDRLSVVELCARDYDPEGKQVRPHSTLIGEYDAVQYGVRQQSKNAREAVRRFLLEPTNTAVGNHSCVSKVNRGGALESVR